MSRLGVTLLVLESSMAAALIIVWVRIRTQSALRGSYWPTASLSLTTMSFLFFLMSDYFPFILGPAYSSRRAATLYINLGIALIALIISFLRKRPLRWVITACAAALALIWLIVGAISSAV